MEQYICEICGYLYDEEQGVPEDHIGKGTLWVNVPEDWICLFVGLLKITSINDKLRPKEVSPLGGAVSLS